MLALLSTEHSKYAVSLTRGIDAWQAREAPRQTGGAISRTQYLGMVSEGELKVRAAPGI